MKIERTGNRDVFAPPMSYAQERLWFLEQLEPGTPLYNIPYIATVRGAVHRGAFNRAVNRLIARHESLRTCFVGGAGGPSQAIHGALSVEVDWEDLGHLDPRTRADRLQAICTAVTNTPFDLRKAPLFRITVVALGLEAAIITTIHHIIADGWSLGVFQHELTALYEEELGGKPAALPPLRIQYADYAIWQREHLRGDGLERLKEYWRNQLEGATTILEIPGDHPRPSKQTFNGDVHSFDLTPALTAERKALSTEQATTLFMTLFAAFAVLLYRLTGHTDVLVGIPIAGRKNADVEHLIGLFVNTLVLRARMQPEQPFLRLLADVKSMTLDAFEYQDMPFEKLVLELNPKRDLSHSPLIQVLFTLQNIPALQAAMGAPEATAAPSQNLDGHTGTSKFDIAFFFSEVHDKLQCSVEFNTDLFSTANVRDISDCFVALLTGIAGDPAASISTYPLMSPAQRQRCLAQSRGADRGASEGLGCHHLVERQCERSPDAIAIAHGAGAVSERMTYAALNAYANRLARELVARGVRAGDNVGICMPRGIRQIAALLAIVKAGAAYIPLDPDYPLERLRFIVRDVNARLLISSADTRVGLDAPVDVVMLERDAAKVEAQSPANLDLPISPEAPLYIIHTSGSTGRPKGVIMPHRSIVNLIEWQARASRLSPGAVTLQFASLNFDVASQEIFSTLTSGGCLQLIDDPVRRDGARLLDFLHGQKVCRLFLPPVALEQLAEAARGEGVTLEELREVIVAGDRLQVTDSVRDLFARAPHARLINQYGPTESHVVSAHTLEGPVSTWPAHPPIGTPIDDVQLYVLDERLEPTPALVAGELYIGGVAVALGYLDRPEETSKRFIPDPFHGGEGLLYRTGDVCRYERNGALTFLGRADHQIKLRGFRIEPGEIEVVLKRYAGVKEATVVKWRSRQGDDHLVAYLVGDKHLEHEKAELRGHLADKLPAYMIPTHFIRLDSFPLTGSGKIDRLKLPEPAEVTAAPDRELTYVAPRTSAEQFLAACWSEVLHVEKVSLHDSFFELGGHSLSATQLVSRIRDEFDLELPLFRVFESPTLEGLALAITQEQAAREDQAQLAALLDELEALPEEDAPSA
jgi:amino acid adenylation domain-containing protein